MLDPGEELTVGRLQEQWPPLSDRWIAEAGARNEQTVNEAIRYQTTSGATYETPYFKIVLHVVNHASYHRGQVASMLRQLGRVPPNTDLMTYYREAAATNT